tara:strand:+ start:807 stop:971 length:165 start_codon:yes stop_codon:yes gene_type:complete
MLKLITTTIALVVLSYVVFVCVVAILNDFGLLNKDYILIYYFTIFTIISVLSYK